MTSLYDNIIFGPIRSRRLGLSLGVNLLPIESKLCSFDCIYCECGWNADHPGRKRFNSREDVRSMLREVLTRMVGEGTPPDVITFAGNGKFFDHNHRFGERSACLLQPEYRLQTICSGRNGKLLAVICYTVDIQIRHCFCQRTAPADFPAAVLET